MVVAATKLALAGYYALAPNWQLLRGFAHKEWGGRAGAAGTFDTIGGLLLHTVQVQS